MRVGRRTTGPIVASDFFLASRTTRQGSASDGLGHTRIRRLGWPHAVVRDEPARKIEAQVMQPVRELAELKPKAITEPKPGHWTFDLGQNMVGVVRLKARAPRARKSPSATPRCSIPTARSTRRISAARRRSIPTSARGDDVPRRLAAAVHLPRLPLRRSDRPHGEARRWTPSPASSSAPIRPAPASSPAPIRGSTSFSRTSTGASAATTSACPPTARSATSGWAGWATRRSSSAPPRSTRTSPRSSPSGWSTSTTASRPTARSPTSARTRWAATARPPGPTRA